MLNPLLECGVERKNIDVLKIGTKYDYKLFKAVPIKLYHDVPQCGYRVLFDDYKVIYMTDTKTVEGISAKNYDLYLVEGNYDEDEIEERIKEKQQEYLDACYSINLNSITEENVIEQYLFRRKIQEEASKNTIIITSLFGKK